MPRAPLTLTVKPSPDPRNAAVSAFPGVGALLLAVPAGWLIGVGPFDAATIRLSGLGGAALGFLLLHRIVSRRSLRVLSGSALRNLPMTLTFDQAGPTLAAQSLPRSTVPGRERLGTCTFILFSAADALLIPDADLPAGTSPDTLTTLVATWKAA